jgi:S-adenosylmethionine synthetase
MIRISEAVLPGHPDKFCDQVADAIIAECARIDPGCYAQVEVSVWSDQVWLSGGICTSRPISRSLRDVVVETGLNIGYVPGSHIDASRYQVTDTVCQQVGDPTQWSHHVNDQAVVIGWAGYDLNTHFLPPEHFLAQYLGGALFAACRTGGLMNQGPDGKLMVRMREEGNRWTLEHVLITLQQQDSTEFIDLCQRISKVAEMTYLDLQTLDARWVSKWEDVELLINPNGPMVHAGSDGDNGQTGRKLAVDFYGPRIPIGGGALSGKHIGHIDRIAAYSARAAAVTAVKSGVQECQVRLAYAPNQSDPLDISYEMTGRGHRMTADFFNHATMSQRYPGSLITRDLGMGTHFYDLDLPWNCAA